MSGSIQDLYSFQDTFVGFQWNAEQQETFYSNLEIAFNKFPNKQIVDLLYPLINEKAIFVGTPQTNKNFLLGQIIVSTGLKAIHGMIINLVTHEITLDGNSSNFAKIVNSMYYVLIDNYLGLFVYYDKKTINDNMQLYDKVYSYFEHLLIKHLKLFELTDERKGMFSLVCKYFFNVHYLRFNSTMAYENAKEYSKLDSAVVQKKDLENYKQITDLYNVLVYLKIVNQTPNMLKYNLTNGIGTFAYLSIHNELHSLIASIILSKYSHPNFKKLSIATHKADEIESIVYNSYLSNISFDTSLIHKFIDLEKSKNIKAKL